MLYRRVIAGLAGTAVLAGTALAVLPEETVAAFTDNVWAGAGGFEAAMFGFGVEGSLNGSTWGDHSTMESAMELEGSTAPGTVQFATPISLYPGRTSYAPLWLRTATESGAAEVSMTAAQRQPTPSSHATLWDNYVTYSVRAIASSVSCGPTVFSETQGTELVVSSTLKSGTPATAFTLPAGAEDPVQMCFSFTLSNDVINGDSSANGQAVYPYWTFTGTPQ